MAPFFLPGAWRADLMAVYGYARLVDDIGDGDLAPGGADAALLGVAPDRADDRTALLDAFEADLHRVFDSVRAIRCCAGSSRRSAAAACPPNPSWA